MGTRAERVPAEAVGLEVLAEAVAVGASIIVGVQIAVGQVVHLPEVVRVEEVGVQQVPVLVGEAEVALVLTGMVQPEAIFRRMVLRRGEHVGAETGVVRGVV